jgi:hypothetical protein
MIPQRIFRIGLVAVALASASCGSVVRQGNGTSFLIIQALEGGSGAQPGEFGSGLQSDVVTLVDEVPTIFSDSGRVTFQLGLKDPGPVGAPSQPTQNQSITVDRYRVRFLRADGRNTPGVDVPYGFDGAFTITVSGTADAAFTLVRHVAKEEAPLAALARNATIINAIAEITFFGRDQTGHEVTASGRISVEFGNFGDPQ